MSTVLTIRALYDALREKLGLEWVSGKRHADTIISSSGDIGGDLSLVGQLNLINQHRIQILGSRELDYLDNLKKNSRKDALSLLFSGQSALIVIAKCLAAPEDLLQAAESSSTPVLSSRLSGQGTIKNLQYYLSNYFAEKITLHGVFMEVMGTGVLITGESSIGKSELALELLTRGHRLIADDATEFSRSAPDTLNGTCPEMLRDFLEVRGLGILNVRAMFGASSIKHNRNLRLIIVLQDMEDAIKMDRLHGSKQIHSILDVEIPEITLPVGPGRNLAVLVETAVRNHILHTKGYDATQAFIERQKRRLENAHQ
ncbi:MAG: HPr(Ser) kinase/phosphatase [Gammaproteobacteria bacterium]|nr:HPr(Ser) kinase/phosphatase [Gammaproteobacteria bacterium]MDH3559645.1 HPr(Ser) kinase/phosphatase [Gammaproteobacteria bacterium]